MRVKQYCSDCAHWAMLLINRSEAPCCAKRKAPCSQARGPAPRNGNPWPDCPDYEKFKRPAKCGTCRQGADWYASACRTRAEKNRTDDCPYYEQLTLCEILERAAND